MLECLADLLSHVAVPYVPIRERNAPFQGDQEPIATYHHSTATC